ncbi:unnamed protein product [Rotaria magnacalcarata]|nr:unnamed protein product [Rotaria magnacalcarata]CAF1983002.1 unnamed protein product [Rotaria magnacalcarata]
MILVTDKVNGAWNYRRFGPDVWSKTYPQCAGNSQSPINIKTACTIQKNFNPFNFTPNYNEEFNFTLSNDGHTMVVTYNGPKLLLNGADLNGNYQFVNFHLHWGPNENVRSEHQVNGIKYTGESHFVYEDFETHQIAVLAFLMKSQPYLINKKYKKLYHDEYLTTNQWYKYFDASQNLVQENDSVTIELNLSLLMGNNLVDFWRYNGSLTVPPCTENVIWTVFKQPIYVFDYEFETFRDDLLFESYRGPQSLHDRQIYRSFQYENLSTIPDQNCCSNIKSKGSFLFKGNNLIYFHLFYINFIMFFI